MQLVRTDCARRLLVRAALCGTACRRRGGATVRHEPLQLPSPFPARDRHGATGLSEPAAHLHGEGGTADREIFDFRDRGAVRLPLAFELQPAVPEVGTRFAARIPERTSARGGGSSGRGCIRFSLSYFPLRSVAIRCFRETSAFAGSSMPATDCSSGQRPFRFRFRMRGTSSVWLVVML